MSQGKKYTQHRIFQLALKKAKTIVDDPQKLKTLLSDAQEKLSNSTKKGGYLSKIAEQAKVLFRMIKAYINGTYRETPWKTIISVIATLLYFVMPIDIIPDFIPVAGFLDDLTIMTFVINSFRMDIEAFIAWEQAAQEVK